MKVSTIQPVKDYNLQNYKEPVGFKLTVNDDTPELLEILREKIQEWIHNQGSHW